MMFDDPRRYVLPALPAQAVMDVSKWHAEGKPTFRRVTPMNPEAGCKNCQDQSYVWVSFCRAGPFRYPPGHGRNETLLYFDGDGQVGRGWFIVKKNGTVGYLCPRCAGLSLEPEAEVHEEPRQGPGWWTEV